ncbi:hypothetical protein [Scatolibacter rhodanostii]|uniref:hypothetical protein n=1 Tax=Scatolibacter rhodanostii TaxID=2014781 RepID=UPI000C06BA5F|nr:hypothetical protein [Scatolibacter rhodanostii]
MAFERGIKYYTKAEGSIKVNFPEDKTVCQYCPYARNEDSLKRWKCLLTGELLLYPFLSIGNECPLKLIDE